MLYFKMISLDDKDVFIKFLTPYPFFLSTYSFTNLYIWRNISDISYMIYNDCLIIMKKDMNNCFYFLEPIGIDDRNFDLVIDFLINYAIINDFDMLFSEVTSHFISKFSSRFKNGFEFIYDRDNADYIYKTQDLIALQGNKYKSQRNHYNYFIKHNDYKVCSIDPNKTNEYIEWLKNWSPSGGKSTADYEKAAAAELLYNYSNLNLYGISVYVNKRLEGFSIGEKLKPDMALIHVEKANPKINGLYSFINKTFLETCFSSEKYVNREEDLGIPNLRCSKHSYHPDRLEASYSIIFTS